MRFTGQKAVEPASIEGLNRRYLADEQQLVRALLDEADPGHAARGQIRETAAELVNAVRRNRAKEGGLDAFLQQYDLSTDEGVL
jgi:RHH-type proline utilization regulon transcriptional repressor/proline dehydrogenase/delta 1-pyrroline-5-carboxylate dehydrogenase